MPESSFAPEQSTGGSILMHAQLLAQLDPAYLADVELILCAPQQPPGDVRFVVLWQQLDIDQSRVQFLRNPGVIDEIDAFVFVTDFHAERFFNAFGIPRERSAVIRNAIHPIPAHQKPADGPLQVILLTML